MKDDELNRKLRRIEVTICWLVVLVVLNLVVCLILWGAVLRLDIQDVIAPVENGALGHVLTS